MEAELNIVTGFIELSREPVAGEVGVLYANGRVSQITIKTVEHNPDALTYSVQHNVAGSYADQRNYVVLPPAVFENEKGSE